MKVNQWTLGLAAAGVVSLASTVQAEEAKHAISSALSSTTLSGYVDTSAIWRFGTSAGGTGGRVIPGRSYDNRNKQDGFNLNVVKLTLEKPLDEGQWAAGYKADLLFGPDAGTFANGIGGVTGSPGGTIGGGAANVAGSTLIKQAYVQLRAPLGNGLDFKIGVFDTIIGYEVFDAGNNPNYSRSFGYAMEPTTYTGILASYRINDIVSLSAGVADPGAAGGINTRANQGGGESIKSYMGSVALTAPKDWGFLKGSTLYFGVVDHGQQAVTVSDQVNYYVGGTLNTPVAGLSVGAAYDYVGRSSSPNGVAGTWANAASIYASFKATDKLTINVREEYAWAKTGFWGTKGAGTAESDKFFGSTVTVDYALWANVVSRAEFRWDHDAAGGVPSYGGNPAGTNQKNITSVALNVIYKF